jgi:hypothetical protein
MNDHKLMIEIVSGLLIEREHLDLVFSEDSIDHFGADALAIKRIFKIGDDLEFLNEGSFSEWTAKAELLVKYARAYGGAYDIVREVCNCHLKRNLDMPAPLIFFCADVMMGRLERPKLRVHGEGKDSLWFRNEMFVRYMKFLLKCDYKEQRSPASEPTSAADILAAAFHRCGYKMITYHTIINVWKNKVFRAELDAALCR